jgi:hypothetical protein
MSDHFVVIEKVSGRTEAEIVRGFLESRGIHCEISQEAAGWVYGFGVGPMAAVDILVPSQQSEEARLALQEYHQGQDVEDEE